MPRSKILLISEVLNYEIMDAARNNMSIFTSCYSVHVNILEVLQNSFEDGSVELFNLSRTIKQAYRLREIIKKHLLLQRYAKCRYHYQRFEISIASCYGVYSLAKSQVKLDSTVDFLIAYDV